MIAEMLRLRCKCGADGGTAPGMKTAARSPEFSRLPGDEGRITEMAAQMNAPAVGAGGNEAANRGVWMLRSYRNNAGSRLYSIRLRYVDDTCTDSGAIPFSHAYVFTDADRIAARTYPERLIRTECYDTYAAVNRRCDLAQAEPLSLSAETLRPDTPCDPVSFSVLREAGLTKESFMALVYSLCVSIQKGTPVILLLPSVTAANWSTEGGSYLGERLIALLLRMLPVSLLPHVSAVSYWDDDPTAAAVSSMNLLICSGRYRTPANSMLIDLQNNDLRCAPIAQSFSFADVLWEIAADDTADDAEKYERLGRFHAFMDMLRGGGRVNGTPGILEIFARLWRYEPYYQSGQPMPQQEAAQTAAEALRQIGAFAGNFPEIELRMDTLLRSPALSPQDITAQTEDALIQVLTAAQKGRTVSFLDCAAALMAGISDHRPYSENGLRFLKETLREEGSDGLLRRALAPRLNTSAHLRPLLTDLYSETLRDPEFSVQIREMTEQQAAKAAGEGRLSDCTALLQRILDPAAPEPRSFGILGRLRLGWDIFRHLAAHTDEPARLALFLRRHERELQLGYPELADLFYEDLFGSDPENARDAAFFPAFMQSLYTRFADETRRSSWITVYRSVLNRCFDDPFYTDPELYDGFGENAGREVLFWSEWARLGEPGYALEWRNTERIIELYPEHERIGRDVLTRVSRLLQAAADPAMLDPESVRSSEQKAAEALARLDPGAPPIYRVQPRPEVSIEAYLDAMHRAGYAIPLYLGLFSGQIPDGAADLRTRLGRMLAGNTAEEAAGFLDELIAGSLQSGCGEAAAVQYYTLWRMLLYPRIRGTEPLAGRELLTKGLQWFRDEEERTRLFPALLQETALEGFYALFSEEVLAGFSNCREMKEAERSELAGWSEAYHWERHFSAELCRILRCYRLLSQREIRGGDEVLLRQLLQEMALDSTNPDHRELLDAMTPSLRTAVHTDLRGSLGRHTADVQKMQQRAAVALVYVMCTGSEKYGKSFEELFYQGRHPDSSLPVYYLFALSFLAEVKGLPRQTVANISKSLCTKLCAWMPEPQTAGADGPPAPKPPPCWSEDVREDLAAFPEPALRQLAECPELDFSDLKKGYAALKAQYPELAARYRFMGKAARPDGGRAGGKNAVMSVIRRQTVVLSVLLAVIGALAVLIVYSISPTAGMVLSFIEAAAAGCGVALLVWIMKENRNGKGGAAK